MTGSRVISNLRRGGAGVNVPNLFFTYSRPILVSGEYIWTYRVAYAIRGAPGAAPEMLNFAEGPSIE